jgi:hypothetical protein
MKTITRIGIIEHSRPDPEFGYDEDVEGIPSLCWYSVVRFVAQLDLFGDLVWVARDVIKEVVEACYTESWSEILRGVDRKKEVVVRDLYDGKPVQMNVRAAAYRALLLKELSDAVEMG